jgi:integrase
VIRYADKLGNDRRVYRLHRHGVFIGEYRTPEDLGRWSTSPSWSRTTPDRPERRSRMLTARHQPEKPNGPPTSSGRPAQGRGCPNAPADYTVGRAVEDWLTYGLSGRDAATVKKEQTLCRVHVIPALGARKLRDLSADDVDRWLAAKSKTLSTRSLQAIHSCLNRAIRRAMARDKVKRNVAALCSIPQGRRGRPSKALTFAQAEAVLIAAEKSRMAAYVVVSLLTGARTEELRALTWDHVFLHGDPTASPPVPSHIAVGRSVRTGGDTKTRKSRRTLALPRRCIDALERHRAAQAVERRSAGQQWREHGLVFVSKVGTPLDPAHVRRDFRAAIRKRRE